MADNASSPRYRIARTWTFFGPDGSPCDNEKAFTRRARDHMEKVPAGEPGLTLGEAIISLARREPALDVIERVARQDLPPTLEAPSSLDSPSMEALRTLAREPRATGDVLAAQTIEAVLLARAAIAKNDAAAAAEHALLAGFYWQECRRRWIEPTHETGARVKAGGSKGGTEKRARFSDRDRKMFDAFREACERRPHHKEAAVAATVADKFAVSAKTVQNVIGRARRLGLFPE